jgi:diadenosine tetraphosphate (Ap4A) HIT family hydrolase
VSGFQLHPQLLADSHPVCELTLCAVRLIDDARWPWLVLVPRQPFLRELMDLSGDDQVTLLREVNRAGRVLQRLFRTDKLNVAALGNVVPQLHVHVIARRSDDPAWPQPVWGVGQAQPYAPEALTPCLAELAAGLTA